MWTVKKKDDETNDPLQDKLRDITITYEVKYRFSVLKVYAFLHQGKI